jgi:hypothetical protein
MQRQESGNRRGDAAAGWERRARAVIQKAVRAGAQLYDRQRDLPGLIRIVPGCVRGSEISPLEEVETIVARLERALRAERSRARSGHWTYDLNRHIALRQAYRAETECLVALRAAQRRSALRAATGPDAMPAARPPG